MTENGDTHKLVKVIWHDAEDGHETWMDSKEIETFGEKTVEVTSIGWEVKRTKLYVTIAADNAHDGTFGRVCKIPLNMVQSIENLSLESSV